MSRNVEEDSGSNQNDTLGANPQQNEYLTDNKRKSSSNFNRFRRRVWSAKRADEIINK